MVTLLPVRLKSPESPVETPSRLVTRVDSVTFASTVTVAALTVMSPPRVKTLPEK